MQIKKENIFIFVSLGILLVGVVFFSNTGKVAGKAFYQKTPTCEPGTEGCGTYQCTNGCSQTGLRTCYSSTSYRTCGNYDSDSCLEWSPTTICNLPNNMCSNGNCYYETFDSSSLDPTKWIELSGTLDEYHTSPSESKYHTAQLVPSDRAATLQFVRQFYPGERLEYDVNYVSGSGNLLSRIFVNDCVGDGCGLQSPQCEGQGWATGGAIGFWNGPSCVGHNLQGSYHVKTDFFNDHVDISFRDPSNQVVTYAPMYSPSNPPYTIKLQTRTGHNGVVHMDYDNVLITGCSNECTNGARRCLNEGYQICGNYDIDSCFEWGSVISCNGTTCNNGECINPFGTLRAELRFNEGSGLITQDSTGNGNTGTLQNGVSWTTNGYSDNALHFDGTDDPISVVKTESVDVTEKMKLEAWIKRDSQQDGTIFSRNGPYDLRIINNKLYGGVYTTGWTEFSGNTILEVGVWYR